MGINCLEGWIHLRHRYRCLNSLEILSFFNLIMYVSLVFSCTAVFQVVVLSGQFPHWLCCLSVVYFNYVKPMTWQRRTWTSCVMYIHIRTDYLICLTLKTNIPRGTYSRQASYVFKKLLLLLYNGINKYFPCVKNVLKDYRSAFSRNIIKYSIYFLVVVIFLYHFFISILYES